MHELPLVFFTVLTQSAVGEFILLLVAGVLKQVEARPLAIGLFALQCVCLVWPCRSRGCISCSHCVP